MKIVFEKRNMKKVAFKTVIVEEPSSAYAVAEDFVLQQLKVPDVWIYSAKSLRSKFTGDLLSEAAYAWLAKDFDAAHRIIYEDLVPMAYVQCRTDIVKKLLAPFSHISDADEISIWKSGGLIYVEYLRLRDLYDEQKREKDQQHCKKAVISGIKETLSRINNLQSRSRNGDRSAIHLFQNINFK